MKHYSFLLLAVIFLLAFIVRATSVPDNLLRAINQVEASGRTNGMIVGDGGKAIGPFQIHYVYWLDSGVRGEYQDCHSYHYSVRVVTAYLNRYANNALIRKDYERLARVHNGGPKGYQKEGTKDYWRKVKKQLDFVY